jgi:hypothetical protein
MAGYSGTPLPKKLGIQEATASPVSRTALAYDFPGAILSVSANGTANAIPAPLNVASAKPPRLLDGSPPQRSRLCI